MKMLLADEWIGACLALGSGLAQAVMLQLDCDVQNVLVQGNYFKKERGRLTKTN
jgi:hypothetical protein